MYYVLCMYYLCCVFIVLSLFVFVVIDCCGAFDMLIFLPV